jgi:hypothetical protein
VADWWKDTDGRAYWVEIRRVPGIGSGLECPTRDRDGHRNGWYELVLSVREGDIIYHYNARESRFVGRSVATSEGYEDSALDAYLADLGDFQAITGIVGLDEIDSRRHQIVALRERLQADYGSPLYLPFQFRSPLRMMSNYFARFPTELLGDLFGHDGLGGEASTSNDASMAGDLDVAAHDAVSRPRMQFLSPFKRRADSDYQVKVLGGRRTRTRQHESLVNTCASWLTRENYEPACNAAVDLGLEDPPVIIEAEIIRGSWATAVREAVGQLYEYRYFKVADPQSGLIFLVNEPVPAAWLAYLERDRQIGAIWQTHGGFMLSPLANRILSE